MLSREYSSDSNELLFLCISALGLHVVDCNVSLVTILSIWSSLRDIIGGREVRVYIRSTRLLFSGLDVAGVLGITIAEPI